MSKYRSLNRTAQRRAFNNNPVITDNTYAGELATPFLTPAVKAADTLAKGYVRQIDGIRNKAVLSVTSIADDVIQAGGASACGFDDGNSVTLTESVLTLSDLKVNEKLCRAQILPTFMGQVGARNAQDWASPEFRNFVIATVAGKTAASVENLVWVGGAVGGAGFLSNDGAFDREGLAAGALAVGASGTVGQAIASITSLNVIQEMGKVYDKAANDRSALLSKPDFALYVNPKTAALYRQALATAGGSALSALGDSVGQGINGQSTNQAIDNLNYLGVPILTCPGMPADCIVAAQRENLVVGSNLNTDYTSTQYIPFYQYDGSDNVGVTMRFGLGMQVGVAQDVIVGTTAAILPE
ncbi:MAG: hypothetical protein CMI60_11220 [Parvibaculum sp.]|nr:hypothetical protein [Parvibaculum sp.]